MIWRSQIVPLLLCIDVEPDERDLSERVDSVGPWRATDECLQFIFDLRAARQERTGRRALLNWFWRADPQIQRTFGTADFALARFLTRVQNAGPEDEHGNHPHGWRWSETAHRWFNDFDNAEWILHCIHTSHQALVEALPQRPTSVRFGDRFTSAAAVREFAALGYRFDLTPEPGQPLIPRGHGQDPLSTGALPDYRKTPRRPYFPNVENPSIAAPWGRSGSLRTIPVSTNRHWWLSRRYPFVRNAVTTLNLGGPPDVVCNILNRAVSRWHRPVVAVMRSGDFAHYQTSLQENLRGLFMRDGIRFATPHTFEDEQ